MNIFLWWMWKFLTIKLIRLLWGLKVSSGLPNITRSGLFITPFFVIRNVKKLSYLGFRVVWCEANGSKKDCVARFSVPGYWISNILRIFFSWCQRHKPQTGRGVLLTLSTNFQPDFLCDSAFLTAGSLFHWRQIHRYIRNTDDYLLHWSHCPYIFLGLSRVMNFWRLCFVICWPN